MKMRKKGGGGGSNWMDTYGDMVTLLLCFFVLLYSISSIDETKYMTVMKSFNPEATTKVEDGGNKGPIDSDGSNDLDPTEGMTQADVDEALEKLYKELKEYTEASDSSRNIEITKGDGYVFVSFDDAVFFDGDSFALRPDGEQVLSDISKIFNHVALYIDEIRIMGHTAQARANSPNDVTADRFLASNRATIATLYVQEHSEIEPARLISVGYGQHRPIDSNATAESRSHNRRVEVMITGRDVVSELGDSVEQYYNLREGKEIRN